MKILYGVQATGNGHITRARTLSKALNNAGLEVDYLFSGRDTDKYFNMETFGDYRCRRGMTLIYDNNKGKVRPLATLSNINLRQFFRDVKSLDLDDYDLVITDFEPITAWAARRQKKTSIGIAHQYAFHYPIPTRGNNVFMKQFIQQFSPADISIGLHWHHYNAPILPPMIEQAPQQNLSHNEHKIVVYLPYGDLGKIKQWLINQPDYQFHVFHDISRNAIEGNIVLHPFSRTQFLDELFSCGGVITHAGFTLCSETIQYGKKLLAFPVQSQFEQLSNAVALQQLGLGAVTNNYDNAVLDNWLKQPLPVSPQYPDVASHLANWIQSGCEASPRQLAESVWSETRPQSTDIPFNRNKL